MEAAIAVIRCRRFWQRPKNKGRRAQSQDTPRQDRAAHAGERFFRKRTHQGGIAERKEIIDRTHELPLVRQCQILELARSTAYYRPVLKSPEELALMRRIDELHLEHPFAGAKMLSKLLKREGNPA